MGLEKAKSLLKLKGSDTFLDFIAKQTLYMREKFGVPLSFMLMNSFSTSADTLEALSSYKTLATSGLGLEFVQNKAPKVTAAGTPRRPVVHTSTQVAPLAAVGRPRARPQCFGRPLAR